MPKMIDAFVAYKFVKNLANPWVEWDAYKLGLIDKKGKTIKKGKTKEEKNAMPMWLTLIRNIKRIIEKLPSGSTKLGSFAAALWLIKEEMNITDIKTLENEFVNYLNENDYLIESELLHESKKEIQTGKYKYNNNIFYIHEKIKPIGQCFNHNIFKITDITGNITTLITINNLEEI